LDGETNQITGYVVWYDYASDYGENGPNPLKESSKEQNKELGVEPKRDSDLEEEDPLRESKRKEEELTEESDPRRKKKL